MTGYERVMRALKFCETDRVPVVPELIQHNLDVAGRKHGEFSTDPEDDPPMLLSHAVSTIEEAVQLEPMDITKGRIPVILQATQLCRIELKDEVFVKTYLDAAPFTGAATLLGPETWMMSLIEEPDLCHEFLKIAEESVLRYGLAAAEAGAHGLAFGDSAASLVSREM